MFLRNLSDPELISQTQSLATEERALTARLLEYLDEIHARGLHLARGHGSLFRFCVDALGFTESQAHARISAMKLSRELPEIVNKVADGKISMTNVAQAQVFFRHEQRAGKAYDAGAKRELLGKLEGLSTRQCERKLAELAPSMARPDRERAISAELTEVCFTADADFMRDLTRLREAWGHRLKDGSYAEVFGMLMRKELSREPKSLEPNRKRGQKSDQQSHKALKEVEKVKGEEERGEVKRSAEIGALRSVAETGYVVPKTGEVVETGDAAEENKTGEVVETNEVDSAVSGTESTALKPAGPRQQIKQPQPRQKQLHSQSKQPQPRSRYIPRPIWRAVWSRDGGACAYVDAQSGRRCGSRFRVQLDHIQPYALGGEHSFQNLRCVCQAHNLFTAEQVFGRRPQAG